MPPVKPHGGATAHPLAWPKGVDRTKSRQNSPFKDKSVPVAIKGLKEELSRLQAKSVVISTNVPIKADGDPYSNPGRMPDPGVAVYFYLGEQPYCMPVDKWATVEENLWAVAKHVEAMRGMNRWGVGSVAQAFAGFKALPATTAVEDWWEVLGLNRETATLETVEAMHKTLARTAHPDVTKDDGAAMARLNGARERARFELSAHPQS